MLHKLIAKLVFGCDWLRKFVSLINRAKNPKPYLPEEKMDINELRFAAEETIRLLDGLESMAKLASQRAQSDGFPDVSQEHIQPAIRLISESLSPELKKMIEQIRNEREPRSEGMKFFGT